MARVRTSAPISIRRYMTLIVLAALLPTGLVAAALLYAFWTDQRASNEEDLIARARTVASLLQSEFDSTESRLRIWGADPDLGRHGEALLRKRLDSWWLTSEDWSHIGFQPASADAMTMIAPASGEGLRNLVDATHRLVRKTHRPVISDQVTGIDGAAAAVVIAVPIVREDGVSVLSAVLDPVLLGRKLAGSVTSVEEVVALVDQHFRIVIRSREPAAFVGRPISDALRAALQAGPEGVIRGETREGEATFTGFVKLRDGYFVGVAAPSGPFDQALSRSLLLLACILALMLLLGILLSRWLLSRINRQIAYTVGEASRLAAGDAVPPVTSRVLELAVISESIRSLFERERAARVQEQAANQAKDDFLAMLGHELRNPLAPIVTSLRAMREQGGLAFASERGVIERQVLKLQRMVDDLLDVARVAHGVVTLEKESVEIARIVEDARETVAPVLAAQRLRLEVNVAASGLSLDGDPGRLCQILVNLLTNAAKFSPPGSVIRIRAERHQERVLLNVIDEGSGISESAREQIFEPFMQGPQSVDRPEGGLGLGLSIARNLARLHGGDLVATSNAPGPGSTFTLMLPFEALQAAQPAPVDPPLLASVDPASAVPTVLVVDDNVDAADSLAELIRLWGYPVHVLNDGRAVEPALPSLRPDLILMDIGLPGMDGNEVAARLRGDAQWAHLRLIALTGYGQAADIERSRQAGFEQHLVKPVDFRVLRQLLESARLPGPDPA